MADWRTGSRKPAEAAEQVEVGLADAIRAAQHIQKMHNLSCHLAGMDAKSAATKGVRAEAYDAIVNMRISRTTPVAIAEIYDRVIDK
jgi:hypothetical protein